MTAINVMFTEYWPDPVTGRQYAPAWPYLVADPGAQQRIRDLPLDRRAIIEDMVFDRTAMGALSGITSMNGRAAGPIIATPALRASIGGSANARTLTTGAGLSSIPIGFAVRFRAPGANTGAMTLNVDGTGAVACRTITGVALPAGYVRTDVDTVAIYDGTFWVVGREVERGSNSNGWFVRYADGTLECWSVAVSIDVTIAANAPIHRGVISASLPATFSSTSDMAAFAFLNEDTVRTWGMCFPNTTSVVTVRAFADVSQTGRSLKVHAKGRWYS
jgi:hypothetical protein